MEKLRILLFVLLPLLLAACKHPLEIQGQGDIVDRLQGVRGCALEEFEDGNFSNCTDNEVLLDETVSYQGLARPGWRFSHWEGFCPGTSQEPYCEFTYAEALASFWDESYPDTPVPPLTAVFVEDNSGPASEEYITARLGATGAGSYAALMNALFSSDSRYRILNQQFWTRSEYDRRAYYYLRQSDSLLGTSLTTENFRAAGAATRGMEFLTLVDTDTSDNDISVSYLTQKRKDAKNSQFSGKYYCGIIGTDGTARFVRVVADGQGGGIMRLESDRQGFGGQVAVSYSVSEDGSMNFSYIGATFSGGLSRDGSLFTGTQVQTPDQGSAACILTSSNQTLGTAAGRYYGAWSNTGDWPQVSPVTAVTELLVDSTGASLESVVRVSAGATGSLGPGSMLVLFDGQISHRTGVGNSSSTSYGMISGDRRFLFLVNTSPSKYPTLIVYVRQGS
jgi:hypothetical protein